MTKWKFTTIESIGILKKLDILDLFIQHLLTTEYYDDTLKIDKITYLLKWTSLKEGFAYWDDISTKLPKTHKKIPRKTLRKFILNYCYPKETYPEYYL